MTMPHSPKKSVTFDVPSHLYDAFIETVHAFFARAHEGTTPAQLAAEIRAQDKDAGIDSLAALLDIAQDDAGQAGVIARFLAGLYNGHDSPFDLTELRGLDDDLFERCLAVLRLDHRPSVEVHNYFPNGAARWQAMIKQWSIGSRDAARQAKPSQINSLTYQADYMGYADAPGYRDVTLMLAARNEAEPDKALRLHFSAAASAQLASDLLHLHRFAWNGNGRRADRPIDASPNEARPDWV